MHLARNTTTPTNPTNPPTTAAGNTTRNTRNTTTKNPTASPGPSNVSRLKRVHDRQVIDALIVIKARVALARVQAARERGGQFADQAVVGHAEVAELEGEAD